MKKLDRDSAENRAINFIMILFTIIFLLFVFLGIKSRKLERCEHLTDCTRECYPNNVDVNASQLDCNCLTEQGERDE